VHIPVNEMIHQQVSNSKHPLLLHTFHNDATEQEATWAWLPVE